MKHAVCEFKPIVAVCVENRFELLGGSLRDFALIPAEFFLHVFCLLFLKTCWSKLKRAVTLSAYIVPICATPTAQYRVYRKHATSDDDISRQSPGKICVL